MKQAAEILQIQTVNGQKDVMKFVGYYCYRNSIAEITLMQDGREIPYMIVWDISPQILRLKFLSSGEVFQSSKGEMGTFHYGEGRNKMELGIRWNKKQISEAKLEIQYELFSEGRKVAQNELKVEVKENVDGTSVEREDFSRTSRA